MTIASQSVGIPVIGAVEPRDRGDSRFRLSLSSSAPARLRLHVSRHLVRVATLAICDWITLAAVNAAQAAWLAVAPHHPMRQYAFAVVLGLALCGCYGPGDQRRSAGSIARAAALGVGLTLWSMVWSSPLGAVAPAVAGLWIATTLALIVERRLVDWAVGLLRPASAHVMRAIVIGTPDEAVALVDHPAIGESAWCHLVTAFDPSRHAAPAMSAELARRIRSERIDTVVLAGSLDSATFASILDTAITAGCQMLSLPRVPPTPTLAPRIVWREGVALVEHTRPGWAGAGHLIKRALDVVGSAVALVLLAPVLAIIAILVRRGDGGPVLFRQARIGRGGRTFQILKFRTMVPGAESQCDALRPESVYTDPRLFKLTNDPRVTRLGAILRRTSLDELPQFWNVLMGDMSLVGPRPPLPSEVALYRANDYARFDVKPGITGPWQVGGRNAIRDFDEVVRLETSYIRRWSIWLDLGLLLRTVPAVLTGRGAH